MFLLFFFNVIFSTVLLLIVTIIYIIKITIIVRNFKNEIINCCGFSIGKNEYYIH